MTISQLFFHCAHHGSWILTNTKKIILFLICFSINTSEPQPLTSDPPQRIPIITGILTVQNQQIKQMNSLRRTVSSKNIASRRFKANADLSDSGKKMTSPRTGITSPSGYWYADESDDEMSDDFSKIQPASPIVRFITGDTAPTLSEVEIEQPPSHDQQTYQPTMVLPDLSRQRSRRDVRRAPFSHWKVCLWLFCCGSKPDCD